MPEEVKAHITGVVFQVTSKAGDSVAAGDPVIVLESMKMEIPVEAPRAGTVREIVVGLWPRPWGKRPPSAAGEGESE
jgi:biotin carboxyl carrier protein